MKRCIKPIKVAKLVKPAYQTCQAGLSRLSNSPKWPSEPIAVAYQAFPSGLSNLSKWPREPMKLLYQTYDLSNWPIKLIKVTYQAYQPTKLADRAYRTMQLAHQTGLPNLSSWHVRPIAPIKKASETYQTGIPNLSRFQEGLSNLSKWPIRLSKPCMKIIEVGCQFYKSFQTGLSSLSQSNQTHT